MCKDYISSEYTITTKDKKHKLPSGDYTFSYEDIFLDDSMETICSNCGKHVKYVMCIKETQSDKLYYVGIECAKNLVFDNLTTYQLRFLNKSITESKKLLKELKDMLLKYGELTFTLRNKKDSKPIIDFWYKDDKSKLVRLGSYDTGQYGGLDTFLKLMPIVKRHLFVLDYNKLRNNYLPENYPILSDEPFQEVFTFNTVTPKRSNPPVDGIYRATMSIHYKGIVIGKVNVIEPTWPKMINKLQDFVRNIIYDYAFEECLVKV